MKSINYHQILLSVFFHLSLFYRTSLAHQNGHLMFFLPSTLFDQNPLKKREIKLLILPPNFHYI